jgi:hypothetical protein
MMTFMPLPAQQTAQRGSSFAPGRQSAIFQGSLMRVMAVARLSPKCGPDKNNQHDDKNSSKNQNQLPEYRGPRPSGKITPGATRH